MGARAGPVRLLLGLNRATRHLTTMIIPGLLHCFTGNARGLDAAHGAPPGGRMRVRQLPEEVQQDMVEQGVGGRNRARQGGDPQPGYFFAPLLAFIHDDAIM